MRDVTNQDSGADSVTSA